MSGRPLMPRVEPPLLLIVLLLLLSGVTSKPDQVHLSITDKTDEMVVWWITDNEPRRSEVRYGTSPRLLDKLATSSHVQQYRYQGTRMRGGYTSGYMNEVVLKDLDLDEQQRTIYYKCGDDRNGWSEVFSFKTRPTHPDAPVTFVTHGDQDAGQDDSSRTKEVLDYMLRYNERNPTDLYIHVGDHSYADGNQHEWDLYGKLMQKYVSQVPIVAAVGNHELENRNTYDPWLHRWRHGERTSNEFWFSFDYGPVHFVILTSEHETRRQWDWLSGDLRRANGNRERVPWIIVVAHHPMYNAGRKGMGQENIRNIEPMFQEYKVSLFICGHCHNYERTKPMFQEKVLDRGDGRLTDPYIQPIFQRSDNDEWGTIHLIVGMGGRRGDLCPKKKWTHGRPLGGRGSAFFTVDRSQLVWRYIDIRGRIQDEFRICSQPLCAAAPRLGPAGRLPSSSINKFNPFNRNYDDNDSRHGADMVDSAAAEQEDERKAVPVRISIPQAEESVGGMTLEQQEAATRGAAGTLDMELPESGAPGSPGYLETNNPVLRDVNTCPTSIVSINLGEAHEARGNVSVQSEAEAPGCYTGWVAEDIVDWDELPAAAARSAADEEVVLHQGGGDVLGDAAMTATVAYYSDVRPFFESEVKTFFQSGLGYVAAAAVGAAVLLGVGVIAAIAVVVRKRPADSVPDLATADDPPAVLTPRSPSTVGYDNPGYCVPEDSDDCLPPGSPMTASIAMDLSHVYDDTDDGIQEDEAAMSSGYSQSYHSAMAVCEPPEAQDHFSSLPVNSHPILHSLDPTPRSDLSYHFSTRE